MSCTFSSTKVLVVVKIPIVKKSSRYQLLQITPIPLKHNATVCQLKIDTEMHHISVWNGAVRSTQQEERLKKMEKEIVSLKGELTKVKACLKKSLSQDVKTKKSGSKRIHRGKGGESLQFKQEG
jgi:hypothetical protein